MHHLAGIAGGQHFTEARRRGAGFVQQLHLFVAQDEVSRGQVAFELGDLAGTGEGGSHARLGKRPCQRDLRYGATEVARHVFRRLENTPVAIGELAVAERVSTAQPSGIGGIAALVFPCQEAARQRAPRYNTHSAFARRRKVLGLDVAGDQRIFELHRDRSGNAALGGDGGRFRADPCRHVGEAVVADPARMHEIAQCLHDFADRRHSVPNVHPVKIDVIGSESLQRSFEGAVNVLRACASGIGIAVRASQ